MPTRSLKITQMLIREHFARHPLDRHPEPTDEMADLENVEAFHAQGDRNGGLLPIYHFNAAATSALVPRGGVILDLGSGSGQYLAHLAHCRPDLRIIGLDLSEPMIRAGRDMLKSARLADRVELIQGDMTDLRFITPRRVDLISSVFSLHHLPSETALLKCLCEIHRQRETLGCAVWLFDHIRPRHPATADVFPEIFTPEAAVAFKRDSRNSLRASFSFAELSDACDAAQLSGMEHYRARVMELYQAHRLPKTGSPDMHDQLWQASPLTEAARRDLHGLRWLLRRVPLDATSL